MRILRLVLILLLASNALAQTNYTNDAQPDYEPALIRATDANGAVTTATVALKDVTISNILYVRSYFVTKDATTTYSGMLPIVGPQTPNGTQSVDPFLWQDQTTSGPAPGRLYCAGIINDGDQQPGGNGGINTNKIVVWRSDDAGRSWTSSPVVIDSSTSSGGDSTIVDKPTITVGSYVSSRGYVFVTYMRKRILNGGNQTYYDIMATRSTNGGVSFETPVVIATSGPGLTFTSPSNGAHVTVSPGNGYIYVTWAHYANAATQTRIMLARSPASGTVAGTWVVDSNGPMGYLFNGGNLNGGESAITVPFARYNFVSNKIAVVWHEREVQGSARADVYYAEKGVNGWTLYAGQKKLKLTDNPSSCMGGVTTDQWYPSLDFNSSGTFTISWYDRSVDCAGNTLYDMSYAKIGTSGTVTQGPTRYTWQLWGLADITGPPLIRRRTGEYQTVWCESSNCYAGFVGSPATGTSTDIFVSTIP